MAGKTTQNKYPEVEGMYPEKITVIVDTREQYPVRFPTHVRIPDPGNARKECLIDVAITKRKLDYGDYCLEGYEHGCVIERKASALELYTNLFGYKDKERQGRALAKLVKEAEKPYLMLEVSPSKIMNAKLPHDTDPEILMNKLMGMVARYGLGLLWLPGRGGSCGRRTMGLTMVHLMLEHVMIRYYRKDPRLII